MWDWVSIQTVELVERQAGLAIDDCFLLQQSDQRFGRLSAYGNPASL